MPRLPLQLSALILTISTLLPLSGSATSQPEDAKAPAKPIFVITQKVQPHEFYREIKYAANIKAFREVQVFSYIDGTVAEKLVENGTKVKSGQAIATVKNIQPGYNYANHVIKAPIAGVVTDFFEEVGTLVSKDRPIVTIADTRKLRVTVPVLQENLPTLQQKDLRVEVLPVGLEQPLTARLSNISPNIDEVLGTTLVEFSLDPREQIVRPGMLAKVILKYDVKTALGLEEKYLNKDHYADKTYIYTVAGDMTAKRRDVETGIQREGFVEIVSGLKEGETVVTQSSAKLKEGQLLTTEKEEVADEKRTL